MMSRIFLSLMLACAACGPRTSMKSAQQSSDPNGAPCGDVDGERVACAAGFECVGDATALLLSGSCRALPTDGAVHCVASYDGTSAPGVIACPEGSTCFVDSSVKLASPWVAGTCAVAHGRCGGNTMNPPSCSDSQVCRCVAASAACGDVGGSCVDRP